MKKRVSLYKQLRKDGRGGYTRPHPGGEASASVLLSHNPSPPDTPARNSVCLWSEHSSSKMGLIAIINWSCFLNSCKFAPYPHTTSMLALYKNIENYLPVMKVYFSGKMFSISYCLSTLPRALTNTNKVALILCWRAWNPAEHSPGCTMFASFLLCYM